MGVAELDTGKNELIIQSHIITYGNTADKIITEHIRFEIESMWNEPSALIDFDNLTLHLHFKITAELYKDITDVDVYQNTDPKNNFFRIEEFAHGNISFVDGLGSNSGYFKLENLYQGSTTAAHEYGHTLGLDHPENMDYRGRGIPGIMYPRGTLVDPQFQYDPLVPAGMKGGTMHPMYRRVLLSDINDLKLHKLQFKNNRAVIGEFTNIFHWNHAEIKPENFM